MITTKERIEKLEKKPHLHYTISDSCISCNQLEILKEAQKEAQKEIDALLHTREVLMEHIDLSEAEMKSKDTKVFHIVQEGAIYTEQELQEAIDKQHKLNLCISCNNIAGAVCLPCSLVRTDKALKKQAKKMLMNFEDFNEILIMRDYGITIDIKEKIQKAFYEHLDSLEKKHLGEQK